MKKIHFGRQTYRAFNQINADELMCWPSNDIKIRHAEEQWIGIEKRARAKREKSVYYKKRKREKLMEIT